MSDANGGPRPLARRDFQTGQDVRWCPGCGDFAVLAQVQKLLPTLGIPRERFVVVSGIGCSSRFPYYLNTYGMHTIHGRAPAIATGLRLARPDLSVWVVTGDGDALAIGGNHFIHTLRRNLDLKILLLNNRIYGLTKGQASPTSGYGARTKTTPFGSIEQPFNPVALALAAGATFVARTLDADQAHLEDVLRQAARHRGTALVEIYQNCVTFNDGAFAALSDPATRDDARLLLGNGQPLLFGAGLSRGIRFRGPDLEVVTLGVDGITAADCWVHDPARSDGGAAYLIARMEPPDFPVPLGVFRAVQAPTFEERGEEVARGARERSGRGRLDEVLAGGLTWVIE
jgi:2-oxoglutarate ferredoxin oxidoreductase subunit beta